ncbi:tetratricopeptide repeat protein [Tenacibaculum amylolyticum]|uniref:tetratricopeptide repeat protein n=1 Tax=Tenacibaculum amylolyticum TaxID=104269 RepID=UPI0038961F09
MKKIITLLLVAITTTIAAQSKYDKGMQKAFDLWSQNKTTEAAQLFERISKAAPDQWLPPYYVATIEILGSFGLKDEATLNSKLKKAQEFLDEAKSISPDNPEIIINQALLNTAYIAFDGQKYGMSLSGKNAILYNKALQLAPNNPRVILGKAEWDMGSARFFNQPIEPYCKDVAKALELFKKEKLPKFYPKYGKDRAKEVLKQCKKS